jgi:hypothetical protein
MRIRSERASSRRALGTIVSGEQECSAHFVANLKIRLANRRPKPCMYVCRWCNHGAYRRLKHAASQATPAGMRRGYDHAIVSGKQDWQAIGHHDGQNLPGAACHGAIGDQRGARSTSDGCSTRGTNGGGGGSCNIDAVGIEYVAAVHLL